MEIGQKLWFVYNSERRGKPHEVTIIAIGRKWITLDNRHRIDKTSLQADPGSYSSPGKCYLSESDYLDELKVHAAWRKFKNVMTYQYTPPTGITVSDINKVESLLRIKND